MYWPHELPMAGDSWANVWHAVFDDREYHSSPKSGVVGQKQCGLSSEGASWMMVLADNRSGYEYL